VAQPILAAAAFQALPISNFAADCKLATMLPYGCQKHDPTRICRLRHGPRAASAATRRWPLGFNTYCLRFQRWNDRKLFDFAIEQKLDAIFLQDSLDPGVMDPKHWAEVRAWAKDAGLHIETGGGAILPRTEDGFKAVVATLRKNIERAQAMGSTFVRALLASDRYVLPPGSLHAQIETAIRVLREVRTQAMDAGVKIGIENHKELQAWETKQLFSARARNSLVLISTPATRSSSPRIR
jgi:hypothetical protein